MQHEDTHYRILNNVERFDLRAPCKMHKFEVRNHGIQLRCTATLDHSKDIEACTKRTFVWFPCPPGGIPDLSPTDELKLVPGCCTFLYLRFPGPASQEMGKLDETGKGTCGLSAGISSCGLASSSSSESESSPPTLSHPVCTCTPQHTVSQATILTPPLLNKYILET
jgi:hypothetical protein